MKIIVAFVLVAVIFAPSTAFGWKSINQVDKSQCMVDCNFEYGSIDSSKPMNFLILAMLSLIGLGVFLQYNRTHKYESFSMQCKICKRNTRGLKCVICESQKQKIK